MGSIFYVMYDFFLYNEPFLRKLKFNLIFIFNQYESELKVRSL
jgi:hypothetical protein